MSEAAKKQAEQLARNLSKVYQGINGTGHKDFPAPREASPASKPVKEKLSDVVFKNLRG